MRLSTRSRLGIIAMLYLADNDRNPINAGTLSRELQVSVSYLEQLFARLRSSGFVTGVRGPSGGYKLAVSAGSISIAKIILAIDEKAYDAYSAGDIEPGVGSMEYHAKPAEHMTLETPRYPSAEVDALWEKLSTRIYHYFNGITLVDEIHPAIVLWLGQWLISSGHMDELPQSVNTVVTNVPGLSSDAYLAGAKLVDYLGFGPLAPNMGLFHTVSSTQDHVNITFLSTAVCMGDGSGYRASLETSLSEVLLL